MSNNRNKIQIANPSLSGFATTILVNDVDALGTSLTVASTSGFSDISTAPTYYYLLIGNYGTATSEIVLASAKTDSTFTVGATKFSHSASDPVTYIPYNQVKFYGRVTSGSAENLLGTVDIDCSQQFTAYEYTGSTYYYFISSYYRSATTAEESGYSDEISLATFTYFSVKKIIESGVVKALTRIDENPRGVLPWSVLIDFVNEGLLEIINAKKKWDFLHTITSDTSVAGTAYIAKPTDCLAIEFLKYNGNKIDFISKMRFDQYGYNNSTQTGTPSAYTIKNNKIYFYPIPVSAQSVEFSYYKYPTTITSLTQEVDKPFATMLTYFVAAHASWARGNDKRGDKFFALFNNQLVKAVEEYTGPIQAGDAEEAERTSIYGYDEESLID